MTITFTFQYGQIRNPYTPKKSQWGKKIYIPVWLDQKFKQFYVWYYIIILFTFQYGQIRNKPAVSRQEVNVLIYIPVWLDQKFIDTPDRVARMYIYIPVWLDQKSSLINQQIII